MKPICGDRFLIIGDAARFVDATVSTGVRIALNRARFASGDILKAAADDNCGCDSSHNFETTIRRGTSNWFHFISLYSRLDVVFTAFVINQHCPLDILRLLQDEVHDEARPEVLRTIRAIVTEAEHNERRPWQSLLGNLHATAFPSTG